MKLAVIGNIPEPTGGAEVFLENFLSVFLKHPKHRATLLRWRRQYLYYFPELVERIYAPPGTVESRERLQIYYLFESYLKQKGERKTHFALRLMEMYRIQASVAAAVLRHERPDLLHVHMLFPNVFLGSVIADALKLPWTATIHGMLEFRLLDRFDEKFPGGWGKLFIQALKKAKRVIVVSDELKAECKRRGLTRVDKISGGVDTDFFTPENNGNKKENILFLGSVRREKGALLLLKAFSRVKHLIGGKLVFVGNKLLGAESVRGACRDRSRVHFLGQQKPDRVRSELRSAKLVVLPSASEGLPISVLEAMACGAPVLTTAVGDLKTLIRHAENGYLLKNRSVRNLSDALVRHGDGRGDVRLCRRARETAQVFSLKQTVRQYQCLYQKMLSGAPRR